MIPLGQKAYEAYCEHTGWKSLVSGQQLPPWNDLKPEIQAAWNAAAVALVESSEGYEEAVLTELREIRDGLDGALKENDVRRVGFFEGRGFEVSRGLDSCPEWWGYGCGCATCMSYGDE